LRAGGLNLVVAAIVFWNTVYLEQAVATLRRGSTICAVRADRSVWVRVGRV
jgi:TnpA family transposase